MWRGERVVVVLPTYNEAASIRSVVDGFEATGLVDEIVVVNNNAHPDTSGELVGSVAREVHESVQGYGAAIQRGLRETRTADLVCICEPDGTFDPEDLWKLLPFLAQADAVFGTRTEEIFIFSGANMGMVLRWGNWFGAKVVEVLFNSVCLTDVGCTFRVLRRRAVDGITADFEGTGSSFGLEMMLLLIRRRFRIVQVPVSYYPRVGESSVTGDPMKTLRLAIEMSMLILRQRFRGRSPRVQGESIASRTSE
jgi:glycosyltransferase involved in cell wall biosynthesis